MLVWRAGTEEQKVLGCGTESWERAEAALTEPPVSEEGWKLLEIKSVKLVWMLCSSLGVPSLPQSLVHSLGTQAYQSAR